MRVSYEWLLEYVNPGVSALELAEMFNLSGVEVGEVERFGPSLPNVVVGEVAGVKSHPGRDNLVIVQADVGDASLSIVCGAKNMQVGDKVVVAKPGSELPGERKIGEAVLYGETSSGMLCSAQELGLELGTADEILILDKSAPVGEDAEKVLGFDDYILHLELTPNRADCLGMIGVAYEVAALTGAEVKFPPLNPAESDEDINNLIRIRVEDEDLCSRYTARILKNIRIGKSPFWLQLRLLKAGIRPISNVVDITNYVMWEFGQPLHAFDLDLVKNGEIVVRRAAEGESLVTLDGIVRKLDPSSLVIVDGLEPIGLAGVMGGENTEIRDFTNHILIEAANFDPTNVRRTARRFNLPSEASQRFEKGVNPEAAIWAQDRTALLVQEVIGGEVAKGIVDYNKASLKPLKVQLRPARVNAILGLDLDEGTMINILTRLGFETKKIDDSLLEISVPLRRADIKIEEDLVEEIARLYGYDKIPVSLPKGKLIENRESLDERLNDLIKRVMVAGGYYECVTYSFINPANLQQLRLPAGDSRLKVVPVQNPFSEEQAVMRTTLIPGLLKVIQHNISHRELNLMLFELGSVYEPKSLPLEELPAEKRKLAIAVTGMIPEANWIESSQEADIFTLKGILQELFNRLGIDGLEYLPGVQPFSHPTRGAIIKKQDQEIGYISEIHPDIVEDWEITQPVSVCEVDLTALLAHANPVPVILPLPRYPAAKRDLALLVSKKISARELENTIKTAGNDLVSAVNLFDVYEGKQIPEGKRSLAYSITFRRDEGTLTDQEVINTLEKIQQALYALGAEVRGQE